MGGQPSRAERLRILSLTFQACYCALDIQECFFSVSHSPNIPFFKLRGKRCHSILGTQREITTETKQNKLSPTLRILSSEHLGIQLEVDRDTPGNSGVCLRALWVLPAVSDRLSGSLYPGLGGVSSFLCLWEPIRQRLYPSATVHAAAAGC